MKWIRICFMWSVSRMIKLFNLSKDEIFHAQHRQKFCLLIYDIVDNKRRVKLSKLLDGYGVRVQKSCYEMLLDQADFKELIVDIENFYSVEEEDNIIIYRGIQAEVVRFNQEEVILSKERIYYF